MSKHDERRGASWGSDAQHRHEPYEWHQPTDRTEPHEDDQDQHAGNGTVNHRPKDQDRREPGPDHAAADATAGDHSVPGPGGVDGGDDTDADRPGAERETSGADDEGPRTDRHGPGRDRLMAALEGLGRDDLGSGVSGTDRTASNGGGAATGPEPEAAPEGLAEDELALRRMLQQAVREIEPRDGSLTRLRRAVPARRARKRQAVVGMAAAALFIGTAIPALVHVSNATGSNADPSIAGQASQAQGGTSQGKGPDGGSSGAAGTAGTAKDKGGNGQKDKGDKGKGVGAGATGEVDPSVSAGSAPACTVDQLGDATATAGAPDSTGAIYGTFRVANTSTASCTVAGAGNVTTVAQGAADPSKVSVVNHVVGDPATALPDPTQEVTSVVLKPGTAYDVKFAWVPSQTCPTQGGNPGNPSPNPSPSDTATTGSGSTTDGTLGTAPQLMTEDGVADGSVAVTNTPVTGSAASTATIPNACAGTVYRTGILLPTS
ncbi:hypothetical protein ACWDR2_19140 [Streptomyces sp. NPDC003631]|uniref:hypothetical protein n=1 Tax=Streptomyces sp. EKR5.2 TaxID=3461014 RepID=UPI0040420749